MKQLDNKINKIFSKVEFLAPWLIRFGLGIAFALHGLGKFPLPPQGLSNFLGSSLASFVAVAELGSGLILIIGGFVKSPFGNLATRFAGGTIVIIMINAFALAHRDWFITSKLFTSEQIFLFLIGLYFLLKGNR
jgi:putative oxidoreductase